MRLDAAPLLAKRLQFLLQLRRFFLRLVQTPQRGLGSVVAQEVREALDQLVGKLPGGRARVRLWQVQDDGEVDRAGMVGDFDRGRRVNRLPRHVRLHVEHALAHLLRLGREQATEQRVHVGRRGTRLPDDLNGTLGAGGVGDGALLRVLRREGRGRQGDDQRQQRQGKSGFHERPFVESRSGFGPAAPGLSRAMRSRATAAQRVSGNNSTVRL